MNEQHYEEENNTTESPLVEASSLSVEAAPDAVATAEPAPKELSVEWFLARTEPHRRHIRKTKTELTKSDMRSLILAEGKRAARKLGVRPHLVTGRVTEDLWAR